ncbi:MAG: hypothetical protein JNK65_07340 [Deltaproteobacteria bacterium]|nr:hypothetical protein [Deltaproteobacteria bacterium]
MFFHPINPRAFFWITFVVIVFFSKSPFSQSRSFAHSENAGWFSEASDSFRPRAEMQDVLGYLWSENLGWVNLSCKNQNTCQNIQYGIRKAPEGDLSGFAWAENVGWIQFKTAMNQVKIDSQTGKWSGKAWSENVGWINFDGNGTYSFYSEPNFIKTQEKVESLSVQEKNVRLESHSEESSQGTSCSLSKSSPVDFYYIFLFFLPLFFLKLLRPKS